MAALDRERLPTDAQPTPSTGDQDPLTDSPLLRLELSPSDERRDLDWSTWIDVVGLLRQHKFVPRIESVDESRIAMEL